MKTLKSILFVIFLSSLLLLSCEKENNPENQKGTLQLRISNPRDDQQKSMKNDIIETEKLTKFEITISKIQVKNSSDELIDLLESSYSVDLKTFEGTPADILSEKIPFGIYKSFVISISGVSIVYDGNSYTANSSGAKVLIGAHPYIEFNQSQGVPNMFTEAMTFELAIDFELREDINYQSVRLSFDAVSSCFEIPFSCPVQTETHYFVGVRPNLTIGAFIEEGIQQIKHSPPLSIEVMSNAIISYYGIHTFVDFDSIGGTINSHTSQHVFRGEDGTLLIDAETMEINANPLSPNTVTSSGETNIRADELFNSQVISTNLSEKGYTLETGKTYYFSLRKTWNITTNGKTYDLTRICEPIPVLWSF
jgi:hypothetical protein